MLYGSVLIYGINIARSVVEEKTSRIFEVLLSTASSDSLMMGKLLGVGATGLTQMAHLGSAAGLLRRIRPGRQPGHSRPRPRWASREPSSAYFAVFFLGGFFLYSGLAAALGSSVSGEQEVQQFSFILISPLVVSVVLLPYVLGNPNAPASVVLSLIPPFTPIIMYMRICSQMPPAWQVAPLHCPAVRVGLGNGVAGGAHLPHRRAHVRQASHAAGDAALAAVQLSLVPEAAAVSVAARLARCGVLHGGLADGNHFGTRLGPVRTAGAGILGMRGADLHHPRAEIRGQEDAEYGPMPLEHPPRSAAASPRRIAE